MDAFTETAIVRREISSSTSQTTPFFGTNCPEVLLSLRHLLPRVQPFSLQRGTVNDLLVGGHLLPDVELGHGENLVLVGNVLPPVVVFNEAASIVQHIAAGGIVPILVEPNIPPVCLVVEIVEQVFRHIDGLHVLHIDAPQRFIVCHARIKLKAIQILRQIDQLFHAAGVFAAVDDRFKLLQIALIQLGDHAGQMIKLVDVLIFAQVVVQPQHIPVKVGDEDFLVPQVGTAIVKSGIPREDIFLTTKVWVEHYGYKETKKSVLESMRKLQTNYLDLVLLHQPFSDYYGAYRALEDLYDEGKLRAIGVSNFYPDRLVDIASFSRVKPMVNQVETHPFNQQIEAKRWMDKYGVQMEAWAPFGEGRGGLFENPVLVQIAEKYKKTTAQIILRWHIQRGVVVIPKSTHKARMEENLNVFDFVLEQTDLNRISELDKKQSSFFSHSDPSMVEWFVRMVEERKGK